MRSDFSLNVGSRVISLLLSDVPRALMTKYSEVATERISSPAFCGSRYFVQDPIETDCYNKDS